MKRCPFLILVLLAPEGESQKSYFGVDVGINVANQLIFSDFTVNGTSTKGQGFQFNTIRPTFGAFYHRVTSDHISVRVNAQYLGLGYHRKDNSGSDVDINYLSIPVTVHYLAYKHLSIRAGSYLSFTLGGSKINSQRITKTYHKNDYGISIGAEHTLYKSFSLGLRYYVGLKNIWLSDTMNGGPDVTVSQKFTNRALQLIYNFKPLKSTL